MSYVKIQQNSRGSGDRQCKGPEATSILHVLTG